MSFSHTSSYSNGSVPCPRVRVLSNGMFMCMGYYRDHYVDECAVLVTDNQGQVSLGHGYSRCPFTRKDIYPGSCPDSFVHSLTLNRTEQHYMVYDKNGSMRWCYSNPMSEASGDLDGNQEDEEVRF